VDSLPAGCPRKESKQGRKGDNIPYYPISAGEKSFYNTTHAETGGHLGGVKGGRGTD